MPLESTIICLDNSEWMRNGDYTPTRVEAQHDAVSLLCGTKLQSNPESTVGILSMAGKSVELLASPTENMGKILGSFHQLRLGGQCRLIDGVKIAQLALKHRPNKRGNQRIVLFIGSPLQEEEGALIKTGKTLKKNNIALDVISLGEMPDNDNKLRALVEAANSSDNSHLVCVQQGLLPSDVLVSTPIFQDEFSASTTSPDASSAGNTAGGDFAQYGGVDPNVDPELALALRVSLEEERARQEAIAKKQAEERSKESAQESQAEEKGVEKAQLTTTLTEEQEMQRALQLSLQGNESSEGSSQSATTEKVSLGAPKTGNAQGATQEKSDGKEQEKEGKGEKQGEKKTIDPPPVPNTVFLDPGFVNTLLSGIPGIDPNDSKIKEAMNQVTSGVSNAEKKEKEEKKEEKKKDETEKKTQS